MLFFPAAKVRDGVGIREGGEVGGDTGGASCVIITEHFIIRSDHH